MKNLKLAILAALLAFSFVDPSQGAAPSSQPATAIEAAKQYTDLFKARKPAEAIQNFWDLDGMFVTIFGDEMKKVSEADRVEMRRELLGLLNQAYANPQIMELMATSKYTDFSDKNIGGGRENVTFTVVFPSGRSAANSLTFEQYDGRFAVVDASTAGQSMGGTIRDAYAKVHDQFTPPQFIKAVTSGK